MKVRWSVGILPFVVAIVMGLGCGGSGSGDRCDGGACGGAAGSGGCDGRCWQPTADDEAFAAEICAPTADCCTQLRGSSSPQHTAAEHAQTCSWALLSAGFSRDAQLRAACTAEVMAAAGSAACMPEFWPPNPSSACARLLAEDAGPLATGQRCAGQGDCQSKPGALAECTLGSDNHAYCHLVSPGKEGDPCIASVNEFLYIPVLSTERRGRYCSAADRLICQPTDSSSKVNVCVPLFADGTDCYRNYECASGECLPPPSGSGLPTGTCATRSDPRDLPDGASCTGDKNCKSAHCTNEHCQSVAQYAGYHNFCQW
jgi:hypothetical protein